MKYVIVHKGEKYIIYAAGDDGKQTGESLGTFDTEADAQAGVKKLRAEADTADDSDDEAEGGDDKARGAKDYWPNSDRPTTTDPAVLFNQAEVNYTLYAVRQNPVNAVCQTCRFFTARRTMDGAFIKHECAVTEAYPLEIVATGYCDQWAKRPLTQMEAEAERQPLEVVIVDAATETADTREKGDAERTLGRYPSRKTLQNEAFNRSGAMFKVLDDGRFVAVWSNNTRDLQDEVFTEKAIDAYVSRVKAGMVPLPVLTHWHVVKFDKAGALDRTGGAVYGEAEWVDRIGHFLVAVGKFHDSPRGRAALKAFKNAAPGEYTMSHGFFTRPDKKDKNGLIHAFNTFEISTLPAGFEANPLTSFLAVKEMIMLTPQKEASLKKLFGEAAAAPIIADLKTVEEASKALDASGSLEFKDLSDPNGAQANDGGDESALKDLFGDIVKDAGALATGLVAEKKERQALADRVVRLEKALELPPTPVEKSRALDPEDPAVKAALEELAQKQKVAVEDDFLPGLTAR